MEDYKVKQLQPNHADHISYYNDKYLNEMFSKETCIAQPKYDGERMLIHINHNEIYCTSRRFSKKTNRYMENQDKLPILQEILNNRPELQKLGYTVIDCECYSKDWSTIAGILHSLPERAVMLQKLNAAKFAVFDCLYFDGIDIRTVPYIHRFNSACKITEMFSYDNLHTVMFINENYKIDSIENIIPMPIANKQQCEKLMDTAIACGFEGIVVKSLNRTYYEKAASLKCKKFETVDVVVYDYVQGRGKYSNTIGALKVGYYDPDTDSIIHMSNVNCSTDAERDAWRDNWNEWKNSVIEVLCQEITDKSLRHPRYIRRRDDKSYNMCTKETIFK